MGQRANYILIEGNQTTIHYNHWRANSIFADLYLGEKKFIKFVRTCKISDVLLYELWMEGCVVVDIANRTVHFWSFEFEITSRFDSNLLELQGKWPGWSIILARNRMYDIEKVLEIDYISQQELPALSMFEASKLADEKPGDWTNATIVIKTIAGQQVKHSFLGIEEILNYGIESLPILLSRCEFALTREDDYETGGYELMIIDGVTSQIFIDRCEFGLWEQTQHKWPGYTFQMGDYGYIRTLQMAGIDTSGLLMPDDVAKEKFNELIRQSTDFNPETLAKSLIKDTGSDVQFNPDFFDNVKPYETTMSKIKSYLKRMLR